MEERDWDQINESTTIESLGFDSLSILDLLYDVETEFGISLDAKKVLSTSTVGEVVNLITQCDS
jgi:acyl carrier protein